ncbi:hypothetical protein BACCIP111895_03132 [Neobacillus rhizosphaerae]|uniref:Stage II sporulation protein P n=1 Tax=Neobacillus rhizosphaerae TaxID=2880965 RepID=A0ABN8KUF1_9BACI|nr:stage II sporulation protein P [Neobacillus rhizosphaerae]CAH2715948.1 hypothetical protein BACCIP111895_03132 [Neobacillus rhizosphaerae]
MKFTYQSILMVIFIFLMISLVVISNINFSSLKVNNSIGILSGEKLFLQFFKSENHTFFPEMDKHVLTVSKMTNLAFQIGTTIKPTDARTFLGNEIPGLRMYDTEIVVAGEGTNLTNLPYESAPPMEVLLNERKVAEESLKQGDTPQGNQPIPNPDKKNVFIYHSHSWESFLPLLVGAKIPNEAVSSDERANVVGLGERLATDLINKGIGVEHNKTNMTQELKKKGWNYKKAYTESREIVQAAAANNANLNYYIDIHRDDARKGITTKTINGVNYARLYFVVGRENKNYLENLELAKALNAELEKNIQGLVEVSSLKPIKRVMVFIIRTFQIKQCCWKLVV